MGNISLNGNWVDLVIIVIFALFIYQGVALGFWIILADFLGFFVSLIVAFRGYPLASRILVDNFSLPHSVANALGFLLTAVVVEGVLGYILSVGVRKIPDKFWKFSRSKIAAIIPAVGEALVITTFVLTLTLSLPITPSIKTAINDSKIGGAIIKQASGIETMLKDAFGGVIEDSLNYLTVEPDSEEVVPIHASIKDLKIEKDTEKKMFVLVNEERKKVGVTELALRDDVAKVAEDYAFQMWQEGYFGHISPDGNDVGYRLDKAGIKFNFAGENLALAPTLQTAHAGLMNSKGHRENILDPDFTTVGIGVVDNGVYGKMFVQVFIKP